MQEQVTQNLGTTRDELLGVLSGAAAHIDIDASDEAAELYGRIQVAVENLRGYREDGEVGAIRL